MSRNRYDLKVAVLLTACISAGAHAPMRAALVARAQAQTITSAPGQSRTRLPDGRWLVIGGVGHLTTVAIEDPRTKTVTALPTALATPRAWHTATLLADGTVLVVGGVDAAGRTISAPERFVPATQAFEPLPDSGFSPRAHHTATLLTDGRVLIAGGIAGVARDDADLWSPIEQTARPVGSFLSTARSGQTATLLADGRVLLAGGGADLSAPPDLFDPATGRFAAAGRPVADPQRLYVADIAPANGARDVPLEADIAMRFSQPIDVTSMSAVAIELDGPDGPVAATIVPAEGGRLLFVTPTAPLQASTTYRVRVSNMRSAHGETLETGIYAFTTRAAEDKDDRNGAEPDDDVWVPNQATGWRTGAGTSPWQSLPPLAAPPGVTALAGQVLKLNGRPLADVTLEIDGREARSDETGRFLLPLPGVGGGRHELEIEGETASRPGRTYGFFEAGLTIEAGRTNVLPYTIWMPRVDMAHRVRIPVPTISETVVTTPFIPGLELHLPAGTVIRDEEGQVVRELGITPIPIDRPPFPLPKNVEVPIYFTIQPGGAYVYNVHKDVTGAQLVYPNYHRIATGVIANFWNYDPDVKDWYVYGPGVVRGPQVFPDPGTRIYAFTGAMINTGATPPPNGPTPGGPPSADPVDASTGLFVLQKTDLYLPDVIPLSLRRTYRPADSATRPFGIGATHDYAMFLWSAQQYTEADLILPDGGRLHYVRTSPGTGWTDAVFEHTSSPTRFYQSTIVWNGHGWDLRLRDGTVYVFGENAPLQAIRDRFGNTVTIEHANGQIGPITRVVSPHGRWIAFTYDASDRVTQVADHIGRTVGYEYDASGRLWKVTDAAGGVTTYTYDASNRLLTITDPRDITYLTNEYDANGRVTLQTQADDSTYQLSYTLDANGQVTQSDLTDPRGHVTRTTYDASHLPTTVVEALGTSDERTTTYMRDATSDRVTSLTDPLGRATDYTYDTLGNVTSVTRLAGTVDAVTTTFTYEPTFSQVATVTDPLSHTTSFTYDSAGHLTTVTDPLSHATTFTYNAAGQPLTITNALNETMTLTYDLGDLVGIEDPLGRTTTRFVDAVGRLLRVTDPLGRSTQYVYDAMNRVTSVTDPLGGQTSFTYDGNQNLLTLTDANSHTTTWTYDDMDRVATRTDPLVRQETYAYDDNGNLSQVTDRKSQVTTYAYDALDRLTLTTFDDSATTAYTYDDGDRLTQIADSVGGTITRTYDDLDRLTSETTPEGTVSYGYDAAGRRTTMDVSNQAQIAYGYDNADRLTSITQGTNVVSFAYDEANRRTSLTLPNGIVTEYGYDAASQLTSLTYKLSGSTIGDVTYTYDAAGQRETVGGNWARTNLPTALASATYDAANQIATFGGVTFTYDANGSLTSDGTNTYTWNARNQLASISGGSSASFVYGGTGRRRSKTIGGTSTAFLYDGLNPVQEQGAVTANLLTGLGIDEYFVRSTASTNEQFLTDALGSTVALSDGSGTVQTRYTYDPFGGAATGGAATTNPFGFTGRESDVGRLHFLRARYYDDALQRFVSEDPLGVDGGDVNLHSYVINQPTIEKDPLGLVGSHSGLPYNLPGCEWPKDKKDRPLKWPGLSFLIRCTPMMVPDLLPIPPVRPGRTGMPRMKGPFLDMKPHPFPLIGPQPHIQINIWLDGIPGTQIPIRIPLPGWPWW